MRSITSFEEPSLNSGFYIGFIPLNSAPTKALFLSLNSSISTEFLLPVSVSLVNVTRYVDSCFTMASCYCLVARIYLSEDLNDDVFSLVSVYSTNELALFGNVLSFVFKGLLNEPTPEPKTIEDRIFVIF